MKKKLLLVFKLFIACSLLCLLLSQNKYRDIPGITILFHDKYRGQNIQYRSTLVGTQVDITA